MNIGMFIVSYFPDCRGGAEQQCRRLSEELVRHGHSVTVLTTRVRKDTPRRTVENGVEIIRISCIEALLAKRYRPIRVLPTSRNECPDYNVPSQFALFRKWTSAVLYIANAWSFMIGSAWVIWRRRYQIDVWHAHVAGLISGWCAFWAKRFGIPAVCKGANLPVFPSEPLMPINRCLGQMRKQMHFIALTQEMKKDLLANGVPNEKVTLIPNGVSIPSEGPRSDPGIGGTVLYVANFTQSVANKAFEVLFDAWAKVHAERPNARLTVAGGGETGRWREFLKERNAEESVVFLGGVENMVALYKGALMLVLPSRCEGISNALLEAQSWGVPAVVSDIPGNVLVVEHEKNGLVVPVGDADALARGIIELLDDTDLRIRLGYTAYDRIVSDFGIDEIARRVCALYYRLLKKQI